MGLFGDKKIVELRMPTGKPGRDGGDALSAWAAALDEHTVAIVTLPKPDGATRKTAWFGALEAHAVIVACEALPRSEISRWVATRMRRNQQTAADDALGFMAERFEGNLVGARQEIEKLAMLFPAGKLTLAQVQAVVADVARYDVFQLGEALLHADTPRVLRMLDGLQAEGESPVLVHHTLQQDIRQLLATLEATSSGKPMQLALREAGVWGPRQFLFERVAPRMSVHSLKPLLGEAAAVDLICKGIPQPGLPREPWAALRHLALGLIGAALGSKATKHLALAS
jgi:DNA polymerase III subunit delta